MILLTITFYVVLMLVVESNFLMRQMWMTPVQVFSVLSSGTAKNSDFITTDFEQPFVVNEHQLKKIEVEIIRYYNYFIEASNNQSNVLFDKSATTSDLFYLFQQRQDSKLKHCLLSFNESNQQPECERQSNNHLAHSALKIQLSAGFYAAVKQYLIESFVDPLHEYLQLTPSEMELRIFVWTSVHSNGSYHSSHHHVDSAISGVFYVNVPPGSGDIEFSDPRGPLPPFGKSLRIKPQAGDLILFPGWLAHSVHPTVTRNARISISFNFHGKWEVTSDVNQGYYS